MWYSDNNNNNILIQSVLTLNMFTILSSIYWRAVFVIDFIVLCCCCYCCHQYRIFYTVPNTNHNSLYIYISLCMCLIFLIVPIVVAMWSINCTMYIIFHQWILIVVVVCCFHNDDHDVLILVSLWSVCLSVFGSQ